MSRYLIPSILAATVLIAAMFAFLPINLASTVHDTIQANNQQLVRATETSANFLAQYDDGAEIEITSTSPFCLRALIMQTSIEVDERLSISGVEIDGNEYTEGGGDSALSDDTIAPAGDGDNVTIDWVESINDDLETNRESLCADGEIEFELTEGGTGDVTNTDIDRLTAYVYTTGDAEVTVDIQAAD